MTNFGVSARNLTVTVFIAVGLCLRAWDLGGASLSRDEAESAINALTITEHGVPTDRYLNLPIFENTLTRAWPESAEYEFKDTSYSDKGMAIYHGWLPLYAMALSLSVLGVHPDKAAEIPRALHGSGEMRRRATAARAPSILFAAVFLSALFLAGRVLCNDNAGILAVAIGSFNPYLIDAARQARYYSAALAIGTLCVACWWQVIRRGAWGDFLSAGVLFVLLFHTHILPFETLGIMAILTLPMGWKHAGYGGKVATLAGIVAAGILPWMWFSGFFDGAHHVPMAYAVLRVPQDLFFYLGQHREIAAVILGAAAEVVLVTILPEKLPVRLVEAIRAETHAIGFLVSLLILSNAVFLFLTPAASFFKGRMTLTVIVPAVLLVSTLIAASVEVIPKRRQSLLIATLIAAGLALSYRSWMPKAAHPDAAMITLVDYLETRSFRAGTRLYALPYDHLPLTFYTGLPVQSVAPVRKEFLDHYPGDVVLIGRDPNWTGETKDWAAENPAMFRGYHVTNLVEFWPVFFYRFVGPEKRSGSHLNYSARIQSARAKVISPWIVYDCGGAA